MSAVLLNLLAGAAGAFLAAWAGAYLGFRRSKKETARDRQIAWHEEVIQGLALFEEQLDRFRRHGTNTVIQATVSSLKESPSEGSNIGALPNLFKPSPHMWESLGAAETRARAALRLGDIYLDGPLQVRCSVALDHQVNIVASHWLDVGVEPSIPWVDLTSKGMATAGVRRALQDSLRQIHEYDGLMARILGARYRRWRTLRRLKHTRKELLGAS